MTRLLLVAALIAVRLPSAAGSPGAPAASAEQRLEQAMARFDEGDFPAARGLLQQAHDLGGACALRGRVALYRGLIEAVENDPALARRFFQQALACDPSLDIDAERHKPALVRLFREVRAALLGRLVVALSPAQPGAAVSLDGVRIGDAPVDREVLAGAHTVELRLARGALLVRRSVTVVAGRALQVLVAPPQSAAPARPAAPPREERGGPARPGRLWTWVAGASALALLAAAIATGASAVTDHDDACALLDDPIVPCAQRTRLRDRAAEQRYRDLQRLVAQKTTATNVCFALAGTLAAGTALLYWIEARRATVDAPRRRPRALRWGLMPAGVSVELDY